MYCLLHLTGYVPTDFIDIYLYLYYKCKDFVCLYYACLFVQGNLVNYWTDLENYFLIDSIDILEWSPRTGNEALDGYPLGRLKASGSYWMQAV